MSDPRHVPGLGVLTCEWTDISEEQVEYFLSTGRTLEDYGIVTERPKNKKEDED